MFELLVELVAAPALVAAATLAARRWGHEAGGLVSAFPAIVGPVLLLIALRQGTADAAAAAIGTLLGLAGLGAFGLAYARVARRAGWRATLLAAWAAAAAAAAAASALPARLPVGLAAAAGSLWLAHRALPPGEDVGPAVAVPRWDLPARLALCVVLVVVLAAAADRLGAVVGGLLAALPVLASILAVFTHRRHGASAAAGLLRGMLGGMAAFVVFCALVAALVQDTGIAVAFASATAAAVAIQAAALLTRGARPLPA